VVCSYLIGTIFVINNSGKMIKRWLIINTIVIALFLPGCSSVTQPYGVLQGKVTIGPIVPVERPGVTYEIPCEVFEARKVIVYDKNQLNTNLISAPILEMVYSNDRYVIFRVRSSI